jgi:hypothetical protein
MLQRLSVLLLIALLGLAAPGCKKQQTSTEQSAGKVLATVNGTTITEGDVAHWMGGSGHGRAPTPELQAVLVARLIDLELLYQKGVALGLDQDPDFQARRAERKENLKTFDRLQMRRLLTAKAIVPEVRVSEAMAEEYAEAHRNEIQTDWHLYALPFLSRQQAEAALAEIRGGAPFEAVAARVAPSAQGGKAPPPWDLGFLPWTRVPPDWHAVVFKLKPGEVSEVVRGRDTGLRIFKLVATRPHPGIDLERLTPDLVKMLRQEQVNAATDAYLAQLRQEASIERFDQAQ